MSLRRAIILFAVVVGLTSLPVSLCAQTTEQKEQQSEADKARIAEQRRLVEELEKQVAEEEKRLKSIKQDKSTAQQRVRSITKQINSRNQLLNKTEKEISSIEKNIKQNEELLKTMVSMDEGAAMLGECAFVPYNSPIRESGIMFYETLFDENAACHLALGRGFTNTIVDYDKYTNEEMKAMGINDSAIHVDFMIGCDTMNIDAVCADGNTVPVFRNGNWAF